jgi:hypothetical protein
VIGQIPDTLPGQRFRIPGVEGIATVLVVQQWPWWASWIFPGEVEYVMPGFSGHARARLDTFRRTAVLVPGSVAEPPA